MNERKAQITAFKILNELRMAPPEGKKVNEKSAIRFLRLCELADMLAAEYTVKGILIDFENTLPHALIGVDMEELVLTGCMQKLFYDTGKNADAINFRRMDGEMIRVSFGIKDILI